MPNLEFGCLPTIIGSMPYKDPVAACEVITRYLRDIPAWPQLPHRSIFEDMNVQVSQGFPGIELKDNRLHVNRLEAMGKPLEQLYAAYLENNADKYPITADYAAGLHTFLSSKHLSPLAVKGQVTGPITWGLSVTTDDGKAIIYDDVLGDAVARFLRLKAAWQEKQLSRLARNTIIFLDEPYMTAFGSVGLQLSKERIVALLDEVYGGIKGIRGVHCCGNTDWTILLQTSIDILNFDAYNYAQSLALYPKEVKTFLAQKRTIAWGIVPVDATSLATETVASLKARLEEAIAPFTRDGLPFKQIIRQSLLTPSCGMPALTEEGSVRALELLAGLSTAVRQRYL